MVVFLLARVRWAIAKAESESESESENPTAPRSELGMKLGVNWLARTQDPPRSHDLPRKEEMRR